MDKGYGWITKTNQNICKKRFCDFCLIPFPYSSFTIDIISDKLWPDTRYEVMVQSYNIFGWSQESDVLYVITPKSGKLIFSMASKPINIRWIRTGSKPNLKIMYHIVLYANGSVQS